MSQNTPNREEHRPARTLTEQQEDAITSGVILS